MNASDTTSGVQRVARWRQQSDDAHVDAVGEIVSCSPGIPCTKCQEAMVVAYLKLVARTRRSCANTGRRLVLLLQKTQWTADDFALEEKFVTIACQVARRRGLGRRAWREFGVEPHILDRANLHSA